MKRLCAFIVLVFARAALAHDADIVYAQLQRLADPSEVKELLTMTSNTLVQLAPVDRDGNRIITDDELAASEESLRAGIWSALPLSAGGKPCALLKTRAALKDNYFELHGTWRCAPGELSQTFQILSVLPETYRVVIGSYVDGASSSQFAQGSAQTIVISEGGARISGLGGWVALGAQHIFEGFDHLAFLLGLLIVARSIRRVLWMVTSFTVAHSITLGLTALNVIRLSGAMARWVEVAIAVSIVWVAIENLWVKDTKHRPFITFAFGLVHGFGFASALKGYGIEREAVTALFGFNLGVELGQASVVLLTVPVLRLLRRQPSVWRYFPVVGSLVIAAAGAFWLVQRLVG